jgi:hypothetical protein
MVVQWLKQIILGEIVVHRNRKQSKCNCKIAKKKIQHDGMFVYICISIGLPFYVPGDVNQVLAANCVGDE